MKYKSSDEFESELMEKLASQARSIQQLRDLKIQLATERLLARFDSREIILQGGAAIKYQAAPSPYTRDVDIIIAQAKAKELELGKKKAFARTKAILAWVKEQLNESTGDFFRFRAEDEGYTITDLQKGEPCSRITVAVELNRHDFLTMELDLALQDKRIPTTMLPGRDMLKFAEVENPKIQAMCSEYLLADKVTLYLKENAQPDFDRPNDIAQAAIIIERCNLNMNRLAEGFAVYAIQRDVVNELVERIPNAPKRWEDQFRESMTEQSKLDLTIAKAMKIIRETVGRVRYKAFNIALKMQAKIQKNDI